jgi:hypothetical protein
MKCPNCHFVFSARAQKNSQPQKREYAEDVFLTEEEHGKLVAAHGLPFVEACIRKLSFYKGAKGATYKSDYKAILSWVVGEVEKFQQNVLKKEWTPK